MVNLVHYFYEQVPGYLPESDDDLRLKITEGTINYLQDNGLSKREICGIIDEINETTDILRPEDLPDRLWQDSLIQRNKFYCHRILQVLPPPPVRREDGSVKITPFFLEMKIRFTMEDLIHMFYNAVGADPILIDEKRDAGSFQYLLSKYSKVPDNEPLDFVLELIELAKRDNRPVTQAIALSQYEKDALENLRGWRNEARLRQTDRIIWRTEKLCKQYESMQAH